MNSFRALSTGSVYGTNFNPLLMRTRWNRKSVTCRLSNESTLGCAWRVGKSNASNNSCVKLPRSFALCQLPQSAAFCRLIPSVAHDEVTAVRHFVNEIVVCRGAAENHDGRRLSWVPTANDPNAPSAIGELEVERLDIQMSQAFYGQPSLTAIVA